MKLTRDDHTSPPIARDLQQRPDSVPRALREGVLRVGDVAVPCYVLPDGTPLITTRGILAILADAKHGSLARYTSRIPEKYSGFSLEPVRFRLPDNNAVAEGYSAEALTAICRAYNDAFWAGDLRADQRGLAARASGVLSAVSNAGITALVWEATGYDKIKREGALQDKLAFALRAEAGKWAPLFKHEFFEAMAPLFNLRLGDDGRRPMCFGAFLAEFFYEWFDEDVYAALKAKNPRLLRGHRGFRHHQFLTPSARDRFDRHQRDVLLLMRASSSLQDFRMRFNAAFRGGGLQLSFGHRSAAPN